MNERGRRGGRASKLEAVKRCCHRDRGSGEGVRRSSNATNVVLTTNEATEEQSSQDRDTLAGEEHTRWTCLQCLIRQKLVAVVESGCNVDDQGPSFPLTSPSLSLDRGNRPPPPPQQQHQHRRDSCRPVCSVQVY